MIEAVIRDPDGAQTPADPPVPSWTSCPSCGTLLYLKRLRRNLGVCPECDHHLPISVAERIAQLADPKSWAEAELAPRDVDPLGFADLRPYRDRLRTAAGADPRREAAVVGTARIGGHPVALVVMDFAFLGGSMGTEVGRRVEHAVELALRGGTPLVVVCASGGARMQEGVLALAQMSRTAQGFGRLREAGVPSFCLLTNPTYGGVSASFASLGDVLIAERGAHLGFAGPRVVQQTIQTKLPAGFQTAESLLEHGLVDRVEPRSALRPLLVRLLALHSPRVARSETGLDIGLDIGPETGSDIGPETGSDIGPETSHVSVLADRVKAGSAAEIGGARKAESGSEPHRGGAHRDVDPWQVVQSARDVSRPSTLDYLHSAFDEFVELHGDRAFGDDPAIVAGLARLDARPVLVIGHQKGHSIKDLVRTHFGMPMPEGFRKATRLLGYAERHGLPVVTLVDTPGANPGLEAEQRGQSVAIAEMLLRIGRLRVPVVATVTGEGGSGGALALCAADRLLMMERSFLSVISPEGCAAILWRDAAAAPQAARALHLLPHQLCEFGVVTRVVAEPPEGAQCDPVRAAHALRAALVQELDALDGVPVEDLIANRSARLAALDAVTAVRP